MKMLNKERCSTDAMCGNAQERDTDDSQIKTTGRSWHEQQDDPHETAPVFSIEKSSDMRSLQSPSQPGQEGAQ